MADGLEFTISAKDQASRAVQTVQKKIQDLGKDLAKGFLSFAAPLTLVQSAIGFVTDAIEAQKKKVQEAIEAYSGIGDKAADIGVNADQFLRLQQAADGSGIAINKVGKLFKEVTGIIEQATQKGSDQERMLKALGFSAEQIASGLLKPTQVIEAMAKTLGSATSNTEQLSLATAMLGKDAADLIPVLLKAQQVISGYGEDPGISPEEMQILEDKKKKDKQKANREAAAIAKREAVTEFLSTDEEGKAIAAQIKGRLFSSKAAAAGPGASGITVTDAEVAAEAEAEVLALIRKRNEEKKRGASIAGAASAAELHNLEMAKLNTEAVKIAEAQMAEADAANNKDDAEALKKRRKDLGELLDAQQKDQDAAAKEAAKSAEKGNKLTVSSLREIGGAMAGEFMPGTAAPVIDYQKETLTVDQKILSELEKINNIFNEQPRPGVDFTKDPKQTTFIA